MVWVLNQGDNIIPIKREDESLIENAEEVYIDFIEHDLFMIDQIIKKYPHAGERYNPEQLDIANNQYRLHKKPSYKARSF